MGRQVLGGGAGRPVGAPLGKLMCHWAAAAAARVGGDGSRSGSGGTGRRPGAGRAAGLSPRAAAAAAAQGSPGGWDGSPGPPAVPGAALRPCQAASCQWHNLCTGQGAPGHGACGSPYLPCHRAAVRAGPASSCVGLGHPPGTLPACAGALPVLPPEPLCHWGQGVGVWWGPRARHCRVLGVPHHAVATCAVPGSAELSLAVLCGAVPLYWWQDLPEGQALAPGLGAGAVSG